MHLPANTSQDFLPPPAGTHAAICFRLIDLGTQQVDWQGTTKHQHKVMLSWELPTELIPTGDMAGQPFTVHQRYTYSSHEKARLRLDLESWRGQAFQDHELAAFDMQKLLGKPCLLGIIHDTNDGKTYANIRSLSRLPKGMEPPKPVNATVYFSLAYPDWKVYDSLSDSLKATIARSPEYAELVKKRTAPSGEPASDGPDDDGSETIPF